MPPIAAVAAIGSVIGIDLVKMAEYSTFTAVSPESAHGTDSGRFRHARLGPEMTGRHPMTHYEPSRGRAANVLPVIREIQRLGASLHDIADDLNARTIGTPRGGRYAKSVKRHGSPSAFAGCGN
jgi:hypothetical protein